MYTTPTRTVAQAQAAPPAHSSPTFVSYRNHTPYITPVWYTHPTKASLWVPLVLLVETSLFHTNLVAFHQASRVRTANAAIVPLAFREDAKRAPCHHQASQTTPGPTARAVTHCGSGGLPGPAGGPAALGPTETLVNKLHHNPHTHTPQKHTNDLGSFHMIIFV